MTDANANIKTTFTADSSPLTRAITQAKTDLLGLVGQAKSAGVEILAAFGVAAAGFELVKGAIDHLKEAYDSLKTIAAESTRLQISPESFQFLTYAANQTETSISSVESGLQKLRRSIGEAEGGNKKLADTFKQLGLNANDLGKLSIDQAFLKVASALKQLDGDPAEQGAIKTRLIGRGGQTLNTILSQLDELKTRFDGLHATIPKEDIETFEDFKKKLVDIETEIKYGFEVALISLIKTSESVKNSLTAAFSAIETKISDVIESTINLGSEIKNTAQSATSTATNAVGNFVTRKFISSAFDINPFAARAKTVDPLFQDQSFTSLIASIKPLEDEAQNLKQAMQDLRHTTVETSSGIKDLDKLKTLFGLDKANEGQTYIQQNTKKNDLPQLVDKDFNDLLSTIKDQLARGENSASLATNIASLKDMASLAAEEAFKIDDKGNVKEFSTSGIDAAVAAVQKAAGIKDKSDEIKVRIEVDKDGMLKAFASSKSGKDIMVGYIKSSISDAAASSGQ